MTGVFSTPLGCTWVTNGMAQGLTDAWLALAREPQLERCLDRELIAFLEKSSALAQCPGLGGFDVAEPPLDVDSRRHALAQLNAELARRLTSPDFDGLLVGARWQALERYRRCAWLEAVEAVHLGIYASLRQPAPALEWHLTSEQRIAVDVLHAVQRLNTAPRPSAAEEYALLQSVTDNVLKARSLFLPSWKAVERHFYRKAELEEIAGRLDEAAASWRVLASILSDPAEQEVASKIALEVERKHKP